MKNFYDGTHGGHSFIDFKHKQFGQNHSFRKKSTQFSLPPAVASDLITEVLHNNSRKFLLKRPSLNTPACNRTPYNSLKEIPGRNQFERNLYYLAGHISETHSLRRGLDGKIYSLSHKIDKGAFYICDNRPYVEKIRRPQPVAIRIVQSFLNQPVLWCEVDVYKEPHVTHMGLDPFSVGGEIKEFTHKIAIVKDFRGADFSFFHGLEESDAKLITHALPLRGVGMAFDKIDHHKPFAQSLKDLTPTTRVGMIIQVTDDFYKELSCQALMGEFDLDTLPLEDNAYALSLFPVARTI